MSFDARECNSSAQKNIGIQKHEIDAREYNSTTQKSIRVKKINTVAHH
jgi:hypothetical protein